MIRPLLMTFALTLWPLAAAATPNYTFSYRTFHYVCRGGQTIDVSYVQTGGAGRAVGGPGFVLLNYRGRQYGLAQAVSGSGARYASLYGPAPADAGLEWWEHQGEGTLSRFTGRSESVTGDPDTKPLLSACKPG